MKNFKVVKKDKPRTGMRIHTSIPMDTFVVLKESGVLRNIDEIFNELILKYLYDEGFIEPIDDDEDVEFYEDNQ